MPASTVVIEERTGQGRTIELRGPGMPKQGAAWESELKLVTTWYPGNPFEATQQVLSDTELPSDWEGVWNTTRMMVTPSLFQDGPGAPQQSVTRASTLRDVVDEVLRSGALLRVTWASDDGRKLVREGRASTRRFSHVRQDDINWTITFVWTGRGESASRVLDFTSENLEAALRSLNATLNDLAGQISANGIASSNAQVPGSTTALRLGQLEAFAQTPQRLLGGYLRTVTGLAARVKQVADITDAVATTPADLQAQLTDAAKSTAGAVRSFVDAVGRFPPETLTDVPASPSAIALAVVFFGDVTAKSNDAARAAEQVQQAAKRRQTAGTPYQSRVNRSNPTDAVTVVRSRASDTFAGLSIRYYGTPDRAAQIAAANNYPGYQVAPGAGQVILIPVLTNPSDSGQSNPSQGG